MIGAGSQGFEKNQKATISDDQALITAERDGYYAVSSLS